jgi:hypothetical protein
MATIGTSNYNALQISVTKRMTSWVSAMGSYTYSRSLDEFSSYVTDTTTVPDVFSLPGHVVPTVGTPLNFNMSSEYGPSDFNRTHIANLGYSVHLPKFTGRNQLMQQVLGGWILSGRYSVSSGEPVNILSKTDFALTNSPNQRPNVLHSWVLPSSRHRIDKLALSGGTWFDPTAFCGTGNATCSTSGSNRNFFPAAGTFGNLSRNAVIGPGTISNNMSLAKTFPIPGREGMAFKFQCDAFGVFNTPNLGTPSNQIGSSLGQITSTSGQRFLQLSGHLNF